MSILNAPILPLMAAVKEGMRDTWGGGWDGNKWTGTNGGIPKNSRSSGICSEGNVPVREGACVERLLCTVLDSRSVSFHQILA